MKHNKKTQKIIKDYEDNKQYLILSNFTISLYFIYLQRNYSGLFFEQAKKEIFFLIKDYVRKNLNFNQEDISKNLNGFKQKQIIEYKRFVVKTIDNFLKKYKSTLQICNYLKFGDLLKEMKNEFLEWIDKLFYYQLQKSKSKIKQISTKNINNFELLIDNLTNSIFKEEGESKNYDVCINKKYMYFVNFDLFQDEKIKKFTEKTKLIYNCIITLWMNNSYMFTDRNIYSLFSKTEKNLSTINPQQLQEINEEIDKLRKTIIAINIEKTHITKKEKEKLEELSIENNLLTYTKIIYKSNNNATCYYLHEKPFLLKFIDTLNINQLFKIPIELIKINTPTMERITINIYLIQRIYGIKKYNTDTEHLIKFKNIFSQIDKDFDNMNKATKQNLKRSLITPRLEVFKEQKFIIDFELKNEGVLIKI